MVGVGVGLCGARTGRADDVGFPLACGVARALVAVCTDYLICVMSLLLLILLFLVYLMFMYCMCILTTL